MPALNRQRLGNILIYTTAALLIGSGGMHLSAFGQINAMAQSADPADVHVLLPALWLSCGIDFIATGVIVGVVALENSNGGRWVLFAAAITPLAGAVVQILYFGFIAPAAALLLCGAMAVASAIVREPRRRRSTTGV
jgi:hypothetical protein